MKRIQFATRFVAYFPDPGDRDRDELARMAALLARSEFHLLRQRAYLLGVITPSSGSGESADWLLDVFPGTAASARLAAAGFDAAQSVEEIHRKAESSAQCYNLLQPSETGFLLESDALGLKPVHIARTPGGHLLGSRIADLLQLLPSLAEPTDTAALYELLGFWAPLMERTLYRQIRRTLPGGCYRWTPNEGLSGKRGRALQSATVAPLSFMDRTIATIRDAAGQSLLEKTHGASQPILLALSGGFDSRFIAALCRELHVDVRAVTYGRRHHSETRSTRAVARALALKLQVLTQPADTTLRWLPQYLEVTEGTADPAAASIMNLRQLPTELGGSVLHGFGGDVQAGAHVGDFSAADYASRESIAGAIIRHYYPASRPGLCGVFSPAPNLDEVRQDVLSGLRSDCPPYQAYLLWYLENRTRRYVATQCALLGDRLDPMMPFYDRRLFDIWNSVPPIGLTNRTVFKALMAHYYPKLARIPHPEELAPVTPNLRWQLARFYHSLPNRLLATGLGNDRARQLLLRLHHHDDTYLLSKLEAPQQRAAMLAELARLRPALKEVFGIELSPSHATVLAADLQALRSLFAVARYAQARLAGELPAAS